MMSDGHGNRLTPGQRVALIAAVSAAAMQLRCKPPLAGELMSKPLAVLAHKFLRDQAESVWGLPACSEWIPPKSATARIRFLVESLHQSSQCQARVQGHEAQKEVRHQ